MKLAFEIVLMSISGVFLAMVILTSVLYVLRVIANIFTSKKEEKKELKENENLFPILAAAAYTALKKPVKIHKVHIHREAYIERWSYAGRMDIHLSHKKSGVNQ